MTITHISPEGGSTLNQVVFYWEQNGYHDSDWFAIHFDGKRLVKDLIGTTRFAGGIDQCIPPTEAQWKDIIAFTREALRDYFILISRRQAKIPDVGKAVTINVKSGKNFKFNGKVGEVFWYGKKLKYKFANTAWNHYPDWAYEMVCGIRFGEEKVWMATETEAGKPKVTVFEEIRYYITGEELEAKVEYCLATGNIPWRELI